MADTGLSKAAKKNQKKRDRKKKAKGEEISKPTRYRPEDLVPLLKEELEHAKIAKDTARASKIREQIWVLNDIIKGVKTDMPESELLPIIASIQELLGIKNDNQPSEEPAKADGATDTEKRIRNLRKKLNSIEELKEKQEKGEKLEESQIKKIEREQEVLDEISELEKMLAEAMSDLGKR